jgi:hypothetical protein
MIKISTAILLLLCSSISVFSQQSPHLESRGKATQLIVKGKPFLILGGELYNSSSSSLTYTKAIWAPLKAMNLNTALVGVSWQLTEPQEGKFDFSLVDGLLAQARHNNMHVVLLWFGSWKNGLSHYTPNWVKTDNRRFPRIVLENGRSTETISALSKNAMWADAKAFTALMKHIKLVDGMVGTVVMVQVENEVGVIGATRDHSVMANAQFARAVPAQLMESLIKYKAELQPGLKKLWEAAGSKPSGTWAEVFGNGPFADEAFMAWNYATYINTITKAGKAAYNIPMFVNTWIVQPEDKIPGDYPSGGPQAHVHDIWRAGAPAIDIKAPDIYLPNFTTITTMYRHYWNPLFEPESFAGEDGAANAFYLIGQQNGIGYSPFGIDKQEIAPAKTPIAKAYNLLNQLTPQILEAQSAGTIRAFKLHKPDSIQHFELGGYQITITLKTDWNGHTLASRGYGLIIYKGADEFIVAGCNVNVSFIPATTSPRTAGLLLVTEGTYKNNVWIPGRILNGDEIMINYHLAEEAAASKSGTGAKFDTEPSIAKVKLYQY